MRRDLAALIDHTLLRPDATPPELERLCEEAAHYNLATVCVNSAHVARCASLLSDSEVRVATTAGFPLGASSLATKVAETAQAVSDGATEIDMVCRIDALKTGDRSTFVDDIRAVVEAAMGHAVKVILETAILGDTEKERGARWACEAGAAFVKTSTGFGPGGATEADVRLLRRAVGPEIGVKASGGIRDAATADRMVRAGANRLGTSAGVAIVTDSPAC
ncbi:MAG: deoxyribose-phosphate aldolase [Myxococcota bacterium]